MFRYWWAYMSCAAFTFLGIWATFANKSRNWVLWGSLALGIAFLLFAAYKVWAKEHQSWADEKQQSAAIIQNLEKELARKHPYDADMEATVGKAIAKLDNSEVRFLNWLLKMEKPGRGEVQRQSFYREPESIMEKTSTLLIGFDSVRPGNGLVEMDRLYYISPKSERAVKNVLYLAQR